MRPGNALLDGRHQLSTKARHHICKVGGIGYGLKALKLLVQAKRRTGYVVHVRMCTLQGAKVLTFSSLLPFRYRFCPCRATAKDVDIIPRAPLRLPRAESLLPLRGAVGRIACIDGGLCGKFQPCKAKTKQESYWLTYVPHGYERGRKPYKPAGMAGERLAGFALQRQQRTCVRC